LDLEVIRSSPRRKQQWISEKKIDGRLEIWEKKVENAHRAWLGSRLQRSFLELLFGFCFLNANSAGVALYSVPAHARVQALRKRHLTCFRLTLLMAYIVFSFRTDEL
jgi:hypothetical protein